MIELSDIVVRYEGRMVLGVDQLTIAPGQITAILGHNGSGKSTLMKVMARQIRVDGGTVRLDGTSIESVSQRDLARRVAYLPQHLPEAAGMSVAELVRLGRYAWRGAIRRWTDDDRVMVEDAMRMTGIAGFADRQADTLSGGERQRAWVAMLLAQAAPMLLLDEPASALDLSHQYELASLLRSLNRDAGRGIVAILHDINLACRFADRIIVLKDGAVRFDGSRSEVMDGPLLTDLFNVPIDLVDHGSSGRRIAVVNR